MFRERPENAAGDRFAAALRYVFSSVVTSAGPNGFPYIRWIISTRKL